MRKRFLFVFLLMCPILVFSQKHFHTCHEISADEFHAWVEGHVSLVILDIRPGKDFKKHVPEAISVPEDSTLISLSDTLDSEQVIVVYDRFGEAGLDVCLFLSSKGFTSVNYVKGGFREWLNLRYSTEKKPKKKK